MTGGPCELHEHVHSLVEAKALPDARHDELMQHIAGCQDCSDAWIVAEAMAEDYRSAIREARIPPAGLVWWKAELRVRQEALGAAGAPITLAQGLACAGAVGIAIGILSRFDISLLQGVRDLLPLPLVYASLGVIGLLTSVALYFALSRD